MKGLFYLLLAALSTASESYSFTPRCAATWSFGRLAVNKARQLLLSGESAVAAVEAGVNVVERDTAAQYFVGVGGFPNADGDVELDAAIMDGERRCGAVLSLPRIATPISVARTVMERCPHNVLSGQGALQWARRQGFVEEDLLLEEVKREWEQWRRERETISPSVSVSVSVDDDHHDTVGLICLDKEGRLAAGTSTSGWKFKLPGRVGDSPLIGSGLYCDGEVGAAVATGDGEEIMRVCLSFLVVEFLRQGIDVQTACAKAIERVSSLRRPSSVDTMHTRLTVGVVAMDRTGRIGAASTLEDINPHRGEPFFPAAYWDGESEDADVLKASLEGASFG